MVMVEEIDTLIEEWSSISLEEAILSCPEEQFFDLLNKLYDLTIEESHILSDVNPSFSFIANSSLSGGGHPCYAPESRQKGLNNMASFAALYADVVHIQNPFSEIIFNIIETDDIGLKQRLDLLFALLNYQYLRALLGRGIVKYASTQHVTCRKCSKAIVYPLEKRLKATSKKLFYALEKALIDKCEVYVDSYEPESVIEDGEMHYLAFCEQNEAYFKKLQEKFSSKRIPRETLLSDHLLAMVTAPIIKDLTDQEWHSQLKGSTYLTDSSFQMKIASKIGQCAPDMPNANYFNDAMSHALPSIYSSDLYSVLELRDREQEAFTVYRDNLTKIIKTVDNSDLLQLEEAFKSELVPQINLIDKKVKDWKMDSSSAIISQAVIGTGLLSAGYFTGLIKPEMSKIITALGAMGIGVSFLSDFMKRFNTDHGARSSDLYFLWKINK